MKKTKFGIPGLDNALHGGVEQGSATLLSGGPGTGKTSMGLQFVYHGAANGERCAYVSLEEKKNRLLDSARMLGMKKFGALVKSGNILLLEAEDFTGASMDQKISAGVQMAQKFKVNRIVIDTLTTLSVYSTSPRWKVAATHPATKLVLFQPSKANIKQFLFNFINAMNRIKATMLFLSEEDDEYTLTQKYVCDSVIEMHRTPFDASQAGATLLRVVKTRRSSHAPGVHIVEINAGKGVSILPASEALK